MSSVDPVLEHYARFDEDTRLNGAFGAFEFARRRALIERCLPAGPVEIADIGGGTGAYAYWLAGRGHRVHLVDRVPRHLDVAAKRQVEHGYRLASLTVADARALPFPDARFDLLLLAGPLYHVTQRAERVRALREARRVLRSGGTILAIAINRFAGLMYGLTQGLVFERPYLDMTQRELSTGLRTNPPAGLNTCREGYFHRPSECEQELSEGGFTCEPCLGVLGPAWQVPDLAEAWADQDKREVLMSLARRVETDSVLSPQLFCAARRI